MTHIVIVLCCCLSSCLSIAHMRTHIYMHLRTSIDRRTNKCTYEHRQTRAHTHLHVQIIRIFTPSTFYVHPFIILPHSLTSLTSIRLHPLILLHLLDFFSSSSSFSSPSSSSPSSSSLSSYSSYPFYSDDAPKKDKVDDGAEKAKALEESKRKKVNLIDAKRGQNAGIALARIKVGFTEVRER